MDTAQRRFPFGRLLFAIVAGFVLAAAVGTGALFAFEGRFADRIYPGVRVAGVDVAGFDRDAVRNLLTSALAGYAGGSVVVTAGGGSVPIADRDLGRAADVEALLDDAFAVGRYGDPMGNAVDGVRSLVRGTDVAPRVTLDAAAVTLAVKAAAARLDQPAVSATAAATATGFATTPAIGGHGLDQARLVDQITQRLTDPAAPDRVELEVPLVPVDAQVGDAAVSAAVCSYVILEADPGGEVVGNEEVQPFVTQ